MVSKTTERESKIIEWDDMDKRKFYSFGLIFALSIRVVLYPTTLIKTRLQVQRQKSAYTGTWDAIKKIGRYEGLRGYYKGFMVNSLTIFSGQCYVTTYELLRKAFSGTNNFTKSCIAGGGASLVAQSITVPIDVVSQRIMMMGQSVDGSVAKQNISWKQSSMVVRDILRTSGVRGFYQGYVASIMTFMPSSALWWPFYHFYTDQYSYLIKDVLGVPVPHIAVQALAGPSAGFTATTFTNPMDIVRARLQVIGGDSIIGSFRELLHEEGVRGFTKGLTARYLASMPTSLVIVLGYETLKKISLRNELKELISM
ncbi:solute carrier family 25 member 44-like [Anneissia japonica]|uniref:solute carrier family 25 member 44-like n=1 Tax=Anneissia japonica TaxID=1529436 RepID=UPI001425A633|nr:solute carrier family 25 member 44-like [Anneissia japonica]XP_033126201.1 solute carrier family 25 member 44-like [Anneissia japonica]